MTIDIRQGDCLELMKDIPDGAVDMILCDLPYGITNLKWDKVIPFEPLWEQYKRITKPNAAIVLFSQMPFTVDVVNSNRKDFRYEIVWHKTCPCGFISSHIKPMKAHENILVFYKKLPTYNPQKRPGKSYTRTNGEQPEWSVYRTHNVHSQMEYTGRFPTDVVTMSNHNGALWGNRKKVIKHGTSKPVTILEYLIKTYSNPGETVLDNCMGSGSTGVACVNTERNFIGFELDSDFFQIAKERIEKAQIEQSEKLELV